MRHFVRAIKTRDQLGNLGNREGKEEERGEWKGMAREKMWKKRKKKEERAFLDSRQWWRSIWNALKKSTSRKKDLDTLMRVATFYLEKRGGGGVEGRLSPPLSFPSPDRSERSGEAAIFLPQRHC